jgi:hypothetical protein
MLFCPFLEGDAWTHWSRMPARSSPLGKVIFFLALQDGSYILVTCPLHPLSTSQTVLDPFVGEWDSERKI